jgi:hypothetical protein
VVVNDKVVGIRIATADASAFRDRDDGMVGLVSLRVSRLVRLSPNGPCRTRMDLAHWLVCCDVFLDFVAYEGFLIRSLV